MIHNHTPLGSEEALKNGKLEWEIAVEEDGVTEKAMNVDFWMERKEIGSGFLSNEGKWLMICVYKKREVEAK